MLMLISYPSFGHPGGSLKKDHDQVTRSNIFANFVQILLCIMFLTCLRACDAVARLLPQSAKTDEVEREARETSAEREITERVTFSANGKRDFVPRDQFPLTCAFYSYYFYPKISSFTLVVSVTIVLDVL